jgi:hypothetical protein
MRPRIDRVLQRLAAEGEALVGLEVEMELDHHAPTLRTRIEPAAPVGPGEARGLVELLHLRLTGISLEAPVLRVTLTGCGARARAEQAALLGGAGRDLQAAGRALARVRAAFGEQAVTRAQLKPGAPAGGGLSLGADHGADLSQGAGCAGEPSRGPGGAAAVSAAVAAAATAGGLERDATTGPGWRARGWCAGR